jgi:hypothetical protein
VIEALLGILALGHIGYIPIASVLGVSEPRIFYVFQGAIGALAFVLAGIFLHRKAWPKIIHTAMYLAALYGLCEQLLVVGCGTARLWDTVFRSPAGVGLCGSKWTGFMLTAFAALLWFIVIAIYERSDN